MATAFSIFRPWVECSQSRLPVRIELSWTSQDIDAFCHDGLPFHNRSTVFLEVHWSRLLGRVPPCDGGSFPAANGAHKFCVVTDLNIFKYDSRGLDLILLGSFGAEFGVVGFWMREARNR